MLDIHWQQPIQLSIGECTLRLLQNHDEEALAAYFLSLSNETKRRFGPHPFDRETAARLCATLNTADSLRFVVTMDTNMTPSSLRCSAPQSIVAYVIMLMGLTEHEPKRFAELGVVLDEQHSCTFAPSVADGLQNQGLASLLMPAILRYVQQRGKRYVVLMGGVQQTNERAVHFYRKHGFKDFAVFEHPDGVWNCDMMLDIDGYR